MQKTDQEQNEHRRDVEHAQRRYQLLNRQQDGIRHSIHKAQKSISMKDETGRDKLIKITSTSTLSSAYKINPITTLWIPVTRLPSDRRSRKKYCRDLHQEKCKYESDESREDRSEPRIDAIIAKNHRRGYTILSDLSHLKTETPDLAERMGSE